MTATLPKASEKRKADHPIDQMFLDRWSPRALSGQPISEKDLMTLFEAARWAPSSYNNQPWRMVYARRDTPAWATHFGLLGDYNKAWCEKAAALILFVSKTTFDHNGQPCITHSFDTGAAWVSLAYQASLKGYVAHGMQGFDYDRAKTELAIPDGYAVEAMIAVGLPGDPEQLAPALKKSETPNDRRPLAKTICEGKFKL